MNQKTTIILVTSAVLILLLLSTMLLIPKQQEAVAAMSAQQSVPTFTPTPPDPAALTAAEPFTGSVDAAAENSMSTYVLPTATPLPEDLAVMINPAAPPVAQATVEPEPTATPILSTVALDANLRGGPGTNYAVVGGMKAGEPLDIIAINEAGDWYLLADNSWIAAFLVNSPPPDVQIVEVVSVAP